MAEAFLRRRLSDAGVEARVHSAGLLSDGLAATQHGVRVMADLGLDTSAHRSRRLVRELVAGADLVLGMAREHVREAVVFEAEAWPRSFTLKELVRRGEQRGARPPGQPFDEWLAKMHAGRERSDFVGRSPDDDIADPIGANIDVYRRTAAEIDDLVRRLVLLAWGTEERS